MTERHSLLERQLRRHGVARDDPQLGGLICDIDEAYRAFDNDRRLLERSLELSSQELLQANGQMRAMFAALPDSFLLVDGAGTIASFRGAPIPHGRVEPASAIGASIRDVFPRHADAVAGAVTNVLIDRMPVSLEIVLVAAGEACTYEARVMPVIEDRALVILRDVTAQRRAVEALRRSEQRFRAMVENATDLVIILDTDGTLRYASASVTRIMGHAPEDWIGMNVLSFIHPQDLGAVAQAFADALTRPGIHAPVRARLRRRSGDWQMLECSANNLLHDESIGGVVVNARTLDLARDPAAAEAGVRFDAVVDRLPPGIPASLRARSAPTT